MSILCGHSREMHRVIVAALMLGLLVPRVFSNLIGDLIDGFAHVNDCYYCDVIMATDNLEGMCIAHIIICCIISQGLCSCRSQHCI